MLDSETQTQQTDPNPHVPEPSLKNPLATKLSIWPPSQRTREAITERLIVTLSTPSTLSKHYGTMTSDEASALARQIEEEAFGVAKLGAGVEEDGIEVLQVYSKEISKRMVEAGKARVVNNTAAETTPRGGGGDAATANKAEDVSSVDDDLAYFF